MIKSNVIVIAACNALFGAVIALNNGVAKTPPMGWMSWQRFQCNTDCKTDYANCLSERLFRQMADIMVSEGYLEAGYEYISIDDCWLERSRDKNKRLVPSHELFPNGMKSLADYLHSKGLKLGIYENIGTWTCAGYPGSMNHLEIDANTFAEWGVDMLKFDGCHAGLDDYEYGFPAMARYLNKTGRPIVYSCEWPMYARSKGAEPDYKKISASCNMFRAYADIYDNWWSVLSMVLHFGSNPHNMTYYIGPDAWGDADQLVIGNFGLSYEQERYQLAMWAIISSPMLMSVDLRTINKRSKALLLNKHVIAISQDKLGLPGIRIIEMGQLSVWRKPVLPVGSSAIAFTYTGTRGGPKLVSYRLKDLGLTENVSYNITEVFDNQYLGTYKPSYPLRCKINPSGVYLIKAVPNY